jgi:hypothetical protein
MESVLFASTPCQRSLASPPAAILKDFLQCIADGEFSVGANRFSTESFPESYFENISFDILLDRTRPSLPVICQSIVTGRSIAGYCLDLPLVLELSRIQAGDTSIVKNTIWFTGDVDPARSCSKKHWFFQHCVDQSRAREVFPFFMPVWRWDRLHLE